MDPDKLYEFMLEEWKETRAQVHLLLEAIWRFEAASIIGLAAFYAWYLARQSNGQVSVAFLDGVGFFMPGLTDFLRPAPGVDVANAFLPCLGALYAAFVLHRLKVEYSILARLTQYTRVIEDAVYRGNVLRVGGWQHFLSDKLSDNMIPPPDPLISPSRAHLMAKVGRPDRISFGKILRIYRNTFASFGAIFIATLVFAITAIFIAYGISLGELKGLVLRLIS